MKNILSENQFDFITAENKEFINTFNEQMNALGYQCGSIGSGYCWGKYMLIYTQGGDKKKKSIARIYIREKVIVLRLYFSHIDQHRIYIEETPVYIKAVFTNNKGDCNHCNNKKKKKCAFRKTYTINDRIYEKCSGVVFEFYEPNVEKLVGYVGIIKEFYHKNSRKRNQKT